MTPAPTTNPPPSSRHLPWMVVLFAGSGCAALIYEIVWFQLLQLVIGLTNVSLGLLLGIFMGGMCLGSLLLPRLVSARHHPLRVYALLELGIALIGLATLVVVPWVARFYTGTGGGLTGLILRGAVAALCLLPPTILMGATLPAAARWLESSRAGAAWLGFFYGGNIAGAVFGCLFAGFYLLRVFDMATATWVAAAMNVAVALLAFFLAARGRRQPVAVASESAPTVQAVDLPGTGSVWPVYLAIALSGMAALGAEVVWTRLLSLLLGGSVYTFSIILAVFLAGLGLGSGAGAYLGRSGYSPRMLLGICQLLLVLAGGWTAAMLAHSLPYWPINPSISQSPWFNFQLDLARCLWAILPATVLWGASFPLALAALARRDQDPARLVGGVYAANTIGAILGALGFSLLVVPALGTRAAQQIMAAISATAALLMFMPVAKAGVQAPAVVQNRRLLDWLLPVSATLVLAGITMGSISGVPWGLVAYGRFVATYGNRLAPGIVAERNVPAGGGLPDIYCTYVGEGLNGTIAVTRMTSGTRSFHSAGKVQASSDMRDMRLQRMLGHISALAHAKPESVLVVACGAGVTAGSFVVHPEVKRIVICDIEALVPQVVAPMFAPENHHVVTDPRTVIVADDGRHFLRTTREKFDIITSDPIDPWVKGCAALNTVEYFENCKARLNPGGVMSLWIPLYESNTTTVKSLVATFFHVFPHGVLWSNATADGGYDAVLFGQAGPTVLDLDQLHERMSRPDHARVKVSLAEVGFASAASLLSTYAGRASDLQEWSRDAQLNTDGNMRLQYLAGWSLNSFDSAGIMADISRHYRFPETLFQGASHRRDALRMMIEKARERADAAAKR